ncbi:ubiquitin carboxyl-terminal hydrolase nonstop [Folsomia candida]|uniref:ubiquitin carboxyl-terminal hydrolase nonstop n=1 Tax=Folsomia candida TaxID=158441 RepID=UPI000B8EE9D3|nr:ubiquitin carboxyl-terminal hydrolase nonstop [Folsomia candida]
MMNEFDGKRTAKMLKKTTCEHLETLKRAGGVKNYAKIHANLVTCVVEGSRELKARLSRCFTCRKVDGFLHSCMHCIFFGCLKRGHLRNHYKETGHPIACDLTYGTIYCFKCTDFLYDRDFEAIAVANEHKSDYTLWMPCSSRLGGLPLAEFFLRWGTPNRFCVGPRSTFGLRGLVNLGHTCFMNCIIQTLIHTPLLRDFFMTERIICSQKHDQKMLKPCIITQLFDLFQEFYNGSRNAVSLHSLLHKIWGNAAHLAGYEQQDAHEFFIAMLEALHLHFAVPNSTHACKCVIDVIFLGRLQSSVTCMVCGHKSITVDPFWDISLDIVGGSNSDPKHAIGLDECLMRYTREEHLGSGGLIRCKDCDRNQESTKQLKFKVLPIILCLHLKRFEHSTNYKKIDNIVRFPERLDLSPFTSITEDKKKGIGMMDYLQGQTKTTDNSRYSLYAVVNHIGSFEGGHYYAYIRHTRDTWYKCDDHMITKASREEVLASPGYLLFYHKEALLYEESRHHRYHGGGDQASTSSS